MTESTISSEDKINDAVSVISQENNDFNSKQNNTMKKHNNNEIREVSFTGSEYLLYHTVYALKNLQISKTQIFHNYVITTASFL